MTLSSIIKSLCENSEGWKTIRGAHVFIGSDGIISKGPKFAVGKHISAFSDDTAEQSLKKKVVRNNKLYKLISDAIDAGPLDGGCYVMAKALQNVLGGKLYSLTSERQQAEHIVLKLDDGTYWDGDGNSSEKTLINRWKRVEGFKEVQLRPFESKDCPESPRNKKLIDMITKHLQE
jgi:hypothetical protein